MWRLMATMIVVSGTGSVGVDSTITDWPTEAECREIIRTIYSAPPNGEIGGHKLTIRMSAQCIPVGIYQPVESHWPPPEPPPPPGYYRTGPLIRKY